jgi:hypothetical protein
LMTGNGELVSLNEKASAWVDLGPNIIRGDPDQQSPPLIVTWTGTEAEGIRNTAALLELEPTDMVRWAVTRILKQATFTPARDRAGDSGRFERA